MSTINQSAAAKSFYEYWMNKGYEKGESQAFWLVLLRQVFGVEEPEKYIRFEEQVKLDHTSFIDAYIAETKVMIEQKSRKRIYERLSGNLIVLPSLRFSRPSAI